MEARIEEDTKGRRHVHDACAEPCAVERRMRIIGGKWTGSILWHLKDGPVRFNDLARMVGGASKKMITERLRQLEAQGLLTRQVMDTAPVSVQYEITDLGRTALDFLDELRKWSESLRRTLPLPEGTVLPRIPFSKVRNCRVAFVLHSEAAAAKRAKQTFGCRY